MSHRTGEDGGLTGYLHTDRTPRFHPSLASSSPGSKTYWLATVAMNQGGQICKPACVSSGLKDNHSMPNADRETRWRLRTSRSHCHLAVHDRSRDDLDDPRVETLLPGMVADGVGRVSVGGRDAALDGRRHRTTGDTWPDWAVTTVVDTRSVWPVVRRAVLCHESQVSTYEPLKDLTPERHEALWGHQSFYRAFSTVNGGRAREADLFEGARRHEGRGRSLRAAGV